MAIHKFWRKARVKAPRRRGTAPLLPETAALSGTARRVNRVVAVVALFGAFGTVALALALTPEGQTSASSAPAPQEDVEISRIEVPPASMSLAAPIETASLNTTVVAMQPPPQPAPKADRLVRAPQAPEERVAQSPATTDAGQAGERDFAMADTTDTAEPPRAAREAAESAGRKLDEEAGRNLEFGLSEPGDVRDAAAENDGVEDVAAEVVATEDVATEDVAADDVAAEDIAAEDVVVEDVAAEETEADVIESAGEADIDEAAETAVEEEIEEVDEKAVEEAAPEEEPAPKVAATRTAPVTTDVNMRARPSNGAAVIDVVPRTGTVEVIGCDYWCEVVYEGKRGFIYKGFVRGS